VSLGLRSSNPSPSRSPAVPTSPMASSGIQHSSAAERFPVSRPSCHCSYPHVFTSPCSHATLSPHNSSSPLTADSGDERLGLRASVIEVWHSFFNHECRIPEDRQRSGGRSARRRSCAARRTQRNTRCTAEDRVGRGIIVHRVYLPISTLVSDVERFCGFGYSSHMLSEGRGCGGARRGSAAKPKAS